LTGLLFRASRRFLLRHTGQLGLAVAGIALGVAVVVGVDLANDSARRAFETSARLVSGRSTHQLVGLDGTLPESLFPTLRARFGIHRAAPVIESRVQLPDLPERPFTLLGLDPLSELPFRESVAVGGHGSVDLARLMTVPATVVLPRLLAGRLRVRPGERIRLVAAGSEHVVEVAGIVDFDAASQAIAETLVFADIATAQELLALAGVISRIDLILAAGQATRLAEARLPGAMLVETAEQNSALAEMTRAFRVNLTALSLLALVVGMFLIYATLSFLVVQRRPLIGIERALGVAPRQLFTVTIAEALLLGAAGTAAGLLLGKWLGSGLVTLVLRTIEDFYFTREVAAVPADPWIYAKGAVMGLGATVLAALAPALEAARTPPRAAMSRAELEARTRRRIPWLALGGLVAAAIAAGLLAIDTRGLVIAFAGLFGVIAAAALLTPALTMLLMRAFERPAAWFGKLPGLLAARGAVASLSRTGVAVVALSVAVATVIGIGVMIGSFRASVETWLDQTLRADFHLRLEPGASAKASEALSPARVGEIASLPGVGGLSLTRWLRLPTRHGDLLLRALEPGPRGWGISIIEGDPAGAWEALLSGDSVVVSEPFARRTGIGVGDTVELPAATGAAAFPVVGVFRDYSNDRGAVLMRLSTYRRHWHDQSLSGIGIYLDPSADAAAVRRALETHAARHLDLQFAASAEIKAASLQVFERTFTITEVLRWLAGFVAFFGILSALSALALERARETAVLRAIGFTPAGVRGIVLVQTGLLGLASGLIAMPLGLILAALLVFVINERAFGWSMALQWQPAVLAGGLLLALVAALLAGILPALRMSRAPLAAALREE
jgi:putative ABC transport system permease protein